MRVKHDEPSRKGKRPRREASQELPESPESAQTESVGVDALPGTIFFVPDTWWRFEAPGREAHPGACVRATDRDALLVKGSGSDRRWTHAAMVEVQPSPSNGLEKTTFFEMKPRRFATQKVALLYPERRAGNLEDKHLQTMRRWLDTLAGIR